MEQLDRQGEGGNPNGAEVDLKYLTFIELKKANPSSFRGTFNPDKAQEWIKAMEKIFSVLVCTEHQTVAFAIYMLKVDTKFWWTSMRRLLESSQTVIT